MYSWERASLKRRPQGCLMGVCLYYSQKCPSTHPWTTTGCLFESSHPSLVTSSGCSEGLLVARFPPLSLCQPSPELLTREICPLEGPQLPEFPWQQPPWRSLLLAKTLISESGCCCFSGRFTNRGREGKNWGERKKKFTPGRRERKN